MSSCGKDNKGEKKYLVTVVKRPATPEIHAQGIIYDAQLREVLQAGDVVRFRSFLSNSGHALPNDMMRDLQKMQTLMHKLIVNNSELTDLHDSSRQWLDSNTVLGSRISLAEASQVTLEEKLSQDKPKGRTILLRTLN